MEEGLNVVTRIFKKWIILKDLGLIPSNRNKNQPTEQENQICQVE